MHTFDNAILLTEQQAAEILQPHMHRKSALTWLQQDRQQSPAIPFELLHGHYYYRDHELVRFVRSMLNPSARFVHANGQLYNERRRYQQRRSSNPRRAQQASPRPSQERRDLPYTDRRRLPAEGGRRTTRYINR